MTVATSTRPAPRILLTGHVNVLVVGAGISGLGLGHYLVTKLPGKSFAIVDSRDAIGGTWDLGSCYPGIRRDSDLHTFGYEFCRGLPTTPSPTPTRSSTTCTRSSTRTGWASESTCTTR